MSDNLRRYRAIRNALTQAYPTAPTGNFARHLQTLAALISGIVGSKSTQLPTLATKVPDGTKPESRVKRFARWIDNERILEEMYFLRNCSTRFEQRADRRKGLLDGLICGQALAFAGIDNRAHRRKQVASPVGPKAIGDLPKDCTHANGLLAGVVGGWERSVFQEQEEIVLDCGVAFLQALALRGVRLEGQAPRQPASEVPSILRERGLGQPVTAFVHGKGPQEQGLHPRGKHRIPSLKGKLTIPQLMG